MFDRILQATRVAKPRLAEKIDNCKIDIVRAWLVLQPSRPVRRFRPSLLHWH
jgi:hypothetical protein